jgi:hypothetical protein
MCFSEILVSVVHRLFCSAVPDTKASILDMTSIIIQGTQGTVSRVQLHGATVTDDSDGLQVEIVDVTFLVLTSPNEFYVTGTTNSQSPSTFLVKIMKDSIISLTVLRRTLIQLILSWGDPTTLS